MTLFTFNYHKKNISLQVQECNSLFSKICGLMFCRRKNASALLFDFKKPVRIAIHSFFVFFPFLAIWIDDKNNVVDVKIVNPFKFSVSPKKSFCKLLEIPINKKYLKITNFVVGEKVYKEN